MKRSLAEAFISGALALPSLNALTQVVAVAPGRWDEPPLRAAARPRACAYYSGPSPASCPLVLGYPRDCGPEPLPSRVHPC